MQNKRYKKFLGVILASMLLVGGITIVPAPSVHAEEQFARQADGKPVFSGNPEDLDAFVDVILGDMTLQEKAIYAVHRYSEGGLTLAKGYTLPSGKGEVDAVQGVYTDFPTMQGLGQSWNLDLINEVGDIIGNERRGNIANYEGMTMMYSAEGDIRVNPLVGRFEEGFSEDPGMVGDMITAMGDGITGNDDENNPDGLWLKVGLGTKHYANYTSEFFRNYGSSYASNRALQEFQLKGFLEAAENGSFNGVMTSYGRINGIPGAASPLISQVNEASPRTLWNVSDFIGDYSLYSSCGNGYDLTYNPDRAHAAALLILSGSTDNNTGGTAANGGTVDSVIEAAWGAPDTYITPSAVVEAVERGIWGVTEADLDESIRGLLELFVRTGCFNVDADGDGKPDGYIYADLALGANGAGTTDENKSNSINNAHSQEVALAAAQQSVVLLKNNNLLPLRKNSVTSRKQLNVVGAFADARFKTVYSTSTPQLDNTNQTPLTALQSYVGEDKVTYFEANKVVAIKTSNGKYVSVDGSGNICLTDECNDSCLFELYSWGQDGYSFKSLSNGKWLNRKSEQVWQIWQWVTTYSDELLCTGEQKLDVGGEWNADGTAITSTMPERFRIEEIDGECSIIAGTYEESFSGGYETAYYDDGMRVSLGSDTIKASASTRNAITDNERFVLEVKEEAGANVQKVGDYAVVVVGIPSQHSMGEGADRSTLAMGQEQYDLVKNVAAKYPGKTIVVVKSNAPVLMEEIQNNANVGAILYAPYGGQYDGYALAQIIFGSVAPTGHLTSTWYNSDDVFPELTAYALPEGGTTETYLPATTMSNLDPRLDIDYTNNDPIDTGLTYMYTDSDNVTYAFGHGLTYGTVDASLLFADNTMKQDQDYNVSVLACNNSDKKVTQVIQVYASPLNSAYGSAAYQKKLIGYERITLKPYEAQRYTIVCDTKDLEIYDVNSGAYILESGAYSISVGLSSDATRGNQRVTAVGSQVASVDLTQEINVFDHAYDSKDITYREIAKENTAKYAGNYYAVMSKAANSYVVIPKANLKSATTVEVKVATTRESGSIQIREGSADGKILATIPVSATGTVTVPVTYAGGISSMDADVSVMAMSVSAGDLSVSGGDVNVSGGDAGISVMNADIENVAVENADAKVVNQLKYEVFTAGLSGASGEKNLYIVFSDADIRLASIRVVE